MGENAAEWVLDGFDAKDPKANRVLRGCDWVFNGRNALSAHRFDNNPTAETNYTGFRLARGRLKSGEAGNR
jgi:hypothetical protein